MAQLVMNWCNDGTPAQAPVFPAGVELKTIPQIENGVQEWLDIVNHMEQHGVANNDEKLYQDVMIGRPDYSEDKCFFLTVDGKPAATVTVLCDYAKKAGTIHMVSCKPGFRGMGLGSLLSDVAMYTLKNEGMETASLRTDDWRIPAIKTYLRIGMKPDLVSEPDYVARWDAIMAIVNGK